MTRVPFSSAHERLDTALAELEADDGRYELTLFVSGASEVSSRAIRDARALCESHLGGRHELTIVDVSQDPQLTRSRQVLATPTLLKVSPGPERMLVGDLSDTKNVLLSLDLGLRLVTEGGRAGPEAPGGGALQPPGDRSHILSDTDQALSDSDRILSDRDQQASDDDQAAHDHGEDESVSTDTSAARHETATRRHDVARQRNEAAALRDELRDEPDLTRRRPPP